MPDENYEILHRRAASVVSEAADERPLSDERHRETASWLREIAEECRDAGEREEFVRLAELFDRRAEQLNDGRAAARRGLPEGDSDDARRPAE